MPRIASSSWCVPDLAQLAFVHDEDAVGALDGGQPMRDHDGRAAFHQARQRLANAQLGFGVDARGGFVQDQEARIVGQRAGETDELLLAGGVVRLPRSRTG